MPPEPEPPEPDVPVPPEPEVDEEDVEEAATVVPPPLTVWPTWALTAPTVPLAGATRVVSARFFSSLVTVVWSLTTVAWAWATLAALDAA